MNTNENNHSFKTINYHITNICNCHCIYCFGRFPDTTEPDTDKAKRVVDAIAAYFRESGICNGRINFAGGEPLLCRFLTEIMEYAHQRRVQVSIVTNGSRLTPELVDSWAGIVSQIGISIDSLSDETNHTIGRCCDLPSHSLNEWTEIADAVHRNGMTLKINTVVSKLNINEDLTRLYRSLKPDVVKFLQMHLVAGTNDPATDQRITIPDFEAYCRKYQGRLPGIRVVEEPDGSMENSYLMINPEGHIQINDGGTYRDFGDCLESPITELMKRVPMNKEKFDKREENR